MQNNDRSVQMNNNNLAEFIDMITKACNAGFQPLITNDFSSWNFPNNFGVKLKDDPIAGPYQILKLQILDAVLDCQSFQYWDDEHPSETIAGIVVMQVKLIDGYGDEIINKTMNMPVIYSLMWMKDKDYKWYFDRIFVNNGAATEQSDKVNNLLEYDLKLQIVSPKQQIVLSTRDRVRRMNRLLYQTWEFD